MSTIAILSEEERVAYDYPPTLTLEARALCFAVTPELENKISRLRTATNQVGFLLQHEACRTQLARINSHKYQAVKFFTALYPAQPPPHKKPIPQKDLVDAFR